MEECVWIGWPASAATVRTVSVARGVRLATLTAAGLATSPPILLDVQSAVQGTLPVLTDSVVGKLISLCADVYMYYRISRYFRVHYILANLVSKIHITKIGIAKINVCIH